VNKSDLERAVSARVIEPHQLEPLWAFLNPASTDAPAEAFIGAEGEEQLKFVRSFGDVFIAIGIVLFVVASFAFAGKGLMLLFPLAACVVLSEWLVRQRRLALPGIVLLIGILFLVAFAYPSVADVPANRSHSFRESMEHEGGYLRIIVAIVAGVLFYVRYGMPFTLFPIALCSGALVMTLVGENATVLSLFALVLGLAVFAVAMWFDRQDRNRTGRLSDCGFWLHLCAAPAITHGFVFLIGGGIGPKASGGAIMSVLLLLFFAGLMVVALWVDRRALLVSSFAYVIGALVELSNSVGVSSQSSMAFVLAGFGLLVVVLGVYWKSIRSRLFARYSNAPLAQWVPSFAAPAA
jgi:hypothetical protein